MTWEVKVTGEEAVRKTLSKENLGGALRNFFNRATILLQGLARERAPVDTGRLRSSITTKIDDAPVPLWGKVGTNVQYAPFMEYGTGLLGDGEGGKGTRHWPPGKALEGWAGRHGISSGYAVAAAIGKRGGLAPRRYLRNALAAGWEQAMALAKRIPQDMAQGGK